MHAVKSFQYSKVHPMKPPSTLHSYQISNDFEYAPNLVLLPYKHNVIIDFNIPSCPKQQPNYYVHRSFRKYETLKVPQFMFIDQNQLIRKEQIESTTVFRGARRTRMCQYQQALLNIQINVNK
ncbi:hypothetical protein SS50377_26289 [Spironucleus salmonicida]|uniref:Uncharacterized protein n=1 Tax=Spironucleus salmonicida TaxID=348837 RepID=V6LAP6_9EUKA|nr:hypothetical protein SS50377_26281 [Spironucleus salmonicida]KAH0572082.1 hypothetical protein SS50377_26289 [Spironucleus salmonicida]|eukprot:EST41293.1 Hypothetical protein SS50377_19244 [Spironucleus salmonicida]